jgi:hypothetical protein
MMQSIDRPDWTEGNASDGQELFSDRYLLIGLAKQERRLTQLGN